MTTQAPSLERLKKAHSHAQHTEQFTMKVSLASFIVLVASLAALTDGILNQQLLETEIAAASGSTSVLALLAFGITNKKEGGRVRKLEAAIQAQENAAMAKKLTTPVEEKKV